MSFRMSLSDTELLSDISNDTKQRAVSATADILVVFTSEARSERNKLDDRQAVRQTGHYDCGTGCTFLSASLYVSKRGAY